LPDVSEESYGKVYLGSWVRTKNRTWDLSIRSTDTNHYSAALDCRLVLSQMNLAGDTGSLSCMHANDSLLHPLYE